MTYRQKTLTYRFFGRYVIYEKNYFVQILPQRNSSNSTLHHIMVLHAGLSLCLEHLRGPALYACATNLLCYHKLLALPLLPAYAILDVFKKIESDVKICVKNDSFDDFLRYFKKQWLQKVIVIFLYSIFSRTLIILLPDWT